MDACSRARSQKAQGTPLDLGDERFRARGKSPLAAEVSGFNVHAGVTVRAVDREGIGRLFRVTVGQGGFGPYLESENRETPDGRKPSAWENELLDGRGSSFGLGIDGGVRFALTPPSAPWVQPYGGVHDTTVVGFDAYVLPSYDGFSLALGVQFGRF